MTPDIMPFVHAQGTWGEIGAQVGQMFAPLIERHVEAWLDHVRPRDRRDPRRCPRDRRVLRGAHP